MPSHYCFHWHLRQNALPCLPAVCIAFSRPSLWWKALFLIWSRYYSAPRQCILSVLGPPWVLLPFPPLLRSPLPPPPVWLCRCLLEPEPSCSLLCPSEAEGHVHHANIPHTAVTQETHEFCLFRVLLCLKTFSSPLSIFCKPSTFPCGLRFLEQKPRNLAFQTCPPPPLGQELPKLAGCLLGWRKDSV